MTEKQTIAAAVASAPSYLHLNDDGAKLCCQCCKEYFEAKDCLLTFTPNGNRQVNCKECVDEHWLSKAKDMGRI